MPTINDLPAEDLIFLANDPGFSDYISADPELDALDAEKFNPALELRMISELSGCIYKIGSAILEPISPLHLSYLWVLDNPYITDSHPKKEIDADIFLFLLSIKNFSGAPIDLINQAAGFCRDHNITFDQADREIREMLAVSYNPLSFHPRTSDTGKAPVYDADWLTRIVSIAARQTNEKASDLMTAPLSSILWWYTQAAKENDTTNSIRRRTPEEIVQAEMERTYELALEYLNSHKRNHNENPL